MKEEVSGEPDGGEGEQKRSWWRRAVSKAWNLLRPYLAKRLSDRYEKTYDGSDASRPADE